MPNSYRPLSWNLNPYTLSARQPTLYRPLSRHSVESSGTILRTCAKCRGTQQRK